MVVNFTCPNCQTVLKVPEQHVGLSGVCNHCRTRITIEPDRIVEKIVLTKKGEPFGNYLKRWFETYSPEKK